MEQCSLGLCPSLYRLESQPYPSLVFHVSETEVAILPLYTALLRIEGGRLHQVHKDLVDSKYSTCPNSRSVRTSARKVVHIPEVFLLLEVQAPVHTFPCVYHHHVSLPWTSESLKNLSFAAFLGLSFFLCLIQGLAIYWGVPGTS